MLPLLMLLLSGDLLVNFCKTKANVLSTATRMEQAYRVEADTFGELQVPSSSTQPDGI